MENKEKSLTVLLLLGKFVGTIIKWLITAGFIYWGWTVLAPHLNAPLFTYWEVFAIRMVFSSVMTIFWKRI